MASLQKDLKFYHRYLLWFSTLGITCLFIPNWFLIIDTMHIKTLSNDPKITNIEHNQNHTLPYQLRMYYDYNARSMAYFTIISYIIVPFLQLICRCICIYCPLIHKTRLRLLLGIAMLNVTYLPFPFSRVVQNSSSGDIQHDHIRIQYTFENQIGLTYMILTAYASYFFSIYLLYLHFHSCNQQHPLTHVYTHMKHIQTDRDNVHNTDSHSLMTYMFIPVVDEKYTGYLIDNAAMNSSLSGARLSVYDIYNKIHKHGYYDNAQFWASEYIAWFIAIVYFSGNIVIPIIVLMLFIVIWLYPFADHQTLHRLWVVTVSVSVLNTVSAFITYCVGMSVFQKRLSSAYFGDHYKDICDEIIVADDPICFAKETDLEKNNFMLYVLSMVLIMVVMIITQKTINIYHERSS
eukprot:1123809_1